MNTTKIRCHGSSNVSAPRARMTLLFLAPYAPNVRHQPREVQKSASEMTVLQRADWFVDLLREHGGEHLLSRPGRVGGQPCERRSDTMALSLVVRVSSGCEYSGPLTQWSRQEIYLWRYLRRPLDAFSLRIQGVVRLDPPLVVHAGERLRANVWTPGAVDVESIRAYSSATTPRAAQQVCAALSLSLVWQFGMPRWHNPSV